MVSHRNCHEKKRTHLHLLMHTVKWTHEWKRHTDTLTYTHPFIHTTEQNIVSIRASEQAKKQKSARMIYIDCSIEKSH